MRCESCGTTNAVGDRFCGQCGRGLALACRVCGSPVPPGQRFCGQCGAAISTPPQQASSEPAATPELRWASVLFLDLVGYTPMTEGRDPEDVRELLMGYFEVAST